jgi:nitrite reductase/ring-hydroxylating ferredoxin subunit
MTWRKTGVALSAFPAGTMREVNLDGTSVLLVRLAEEVYGLAAVCSHEGGILLDGTLADRRLTCPVHGAVFDAGTGAVLADPDGIEPPEGRIDPLARYATRVLDDMIEVDLRV